MNTGPFNDMSSLALRQFFPRELPLRLQAARFKLVARPGDRGPLMAGGLVPVCVAHR